ncbi:MAG TPA: hypothetical protein VKB79_06945 [Bryobacteraceae bacterium]|nr:hypothetical protein [Bryobacteraceae bacterium]
MSNVTNSRFTPENEEASKLSSIKDGGMTEGAPAPAVGCLGGNCLTCPSCRLAESHSQNSVESYAGSPYLSGTEPDFPTRIERDLPVKVEPDLPVKIGLEEGELALVSGGVCDNCLTCPHGCLVGNHRQNTVEPYVGSPYLSGTEPDFPIETDPGRDELALVSGAAGHNCLTCPYCCLVNAVNQNPAKPERASH